MANRLYILRTGGISMPKRWIRAGGSDDYVDIPVLSYLVDTGDRLILIDCGCAPAVAHDPAEAWGKLASLYHPQVEADDLVDAQIRKAGFQVSDVTDVILTHLHMDHVGGLQLLDRPRIWLQRAEYRAGLYPDPHNAGGLYQKEFDIPGLDLALLDGDTQIADGVQCILTTGHTVGHQSVLIRLDSQLICIVGDAAYNRQLLDRRTSPALAWNVGDYMHSLTRLSTLETFFGANLLFNHDADQVLSLPHSPDHLS